MPPNYYPGPPRGAFDPGSFWGYAVLDAEGRQEQADWRWHRYDRVNPPWSLYIGASSHDEVPLRMEHGRASLEASWGEPWSSPEGVRLQLARGPDSQNWIVEGSPTNGGHLTLSVPWPELRALSREAPSLTLLVRANGTVIEHWTVEPALIETAAREIDAGIAALAERTADYRNLCEAIDDLDPVPIHVT